MKIDLRLEKPVSKNRESDRTNVYIWKNIKDLKSFYAGIVSPAEIDLLAEDITHGLKMNNRKAFVRRDGLGDVLNESCLCNLVEIALLDRSEVLNVFLDKPIAFH